MGIDVTANLSFGVDIGEECPDWLNPDEDWEDELYELSEVELVRHGSDGYMCSILACPDSVAGADWGTAESVRMPLLDEAVLIEFREFLKAHGITEEPEWLLSALMW